MTVRSITSSYTPVSGVSRHFCPEFHEYNAEFVRSITRCSIRAQSEPPKTAPRDIPDSFISPPIARQSHVQFCEVEKTAHGPSQSDLFSVS